MTNPIPLCRGKQFGNKELRLKQVRPLTEAQKSVFWNYKQGKHLVLHGYPKTGKTFLALYLAIKDVLAEEYEKVIVVRSVVPSRDIGFLKGSLKDKISQYEIPYIDHFETLFDNQQAAELLRRKKLFDFQVTSFMRGRTLSDCVVVLDEFQNMDNGEINTMITRLGENTRLIVCGDFRQCDLRYEISGFGMSYRAFQRMDSVSIIEFGMNDIVGTDLVKEWVRATEGETFKR